MPSLHRISALAVLTAAFLLTGCDRSNPSQPAQRSDQTGTKDAGDAVAPAVEGPLVLYCGRSTSLVQPMLEEFTEATGIVVELKDGSTTDLAALLKTEGSASPADVFWAQDPGSLGDLADDGLLAELPEPVLSKVSEKFRGDQGRWVATSGRARVLAYSPKRVEQGQLPTSVFDLTDPKWKGRVGWAPSNGSFQAFLAAMRAVHGEEKARAWVEGMVANEAKVYPKNTPIIEAIAAGEIDLGLPNHYYLLRFKQSEGADYPVEQTFFADGDIGNLLMVAGAGVLKSSDNKAAAERFIAFMLSPEAQAYFSQEVFEYPVAADAKPHELLVDVQKLAEVVPTVGVEKMSEMEGVKTLLREAGLF